MIVLLLVVALILALVKFWYITLGALGIYLAVVCFARFREAERREARDRLRHARARQEIDRIAAATAAMVEGQAYPAGSLL